MTGTEQLPPLDLSLLAKVTPDTLNEDAAPELPPNATPDAELPPPRSRRAPGAGRSGEPRARGRGAARSPRAEEVTDEPLHYRPGILVKPLAELYGSVGTLVLPFNQPVGTAFIQNAQACAEALDNAARQDPRIRRVLMSLIATSIWGQLIAAHMPILMALAVTMVPQVRDSVATINRAASDPTYRQGQPPDEESATVNPVSNGRGPTR